MKLQVSPVQGCQALALALAVGLLYWEYYSHLGV